MYVYFFANFADLCQILNVKNNSPYNVYFCLVILSLFSRLGKEEYKVKGGILLSQMNCRNLVSSLVNNDTITKKKKLVQKLHREQKFGLNLFICSNRL